MNHHNGKKVGEYLQTTSGKTSTKLVNRGKQHGKKMFQKFGANALTSLLDVQQSLEEFVKKTQCIC